MSFLQAGFLIGLAAMAIPVLIHLLSRWQVRTVELGTMRFLQEVIAEASARRRIRRWLLLLTRMAIVAVIALLFARPFLSEVAHSGSEQLRVILIDRSASMTMPGEKGRVIDDAIAAASRIAGPENAEQATLIGLFDHHVAPIDSIAEIDLRPSGMHSRASFEAGLAWANDMIAQSGARHAEVVLITDMQQSSVDVHEDLGVAPSSLPEDVPVQVIDVGRPASRNLAIIAMPPPPSILPANSRLELTATLFNYGSIAYTGIDVIATAVNGPHIRRTKKRVDVPGHEALEVHLDLGKLPVGAWNITLEIGVEDDLFFDNQRFASVIVSDATDVLVVDSGTGDDPQAAESYFLMAALAQSDIRSASHVQFDPRVVYMQDVTRVPMFDPARTPLVIVADASHLDDIRLAQRIADYARDGGSLILFSGKTMREGVASGLSRVGLAPGKLGSVRHSAAMPFRIVRVDQEASMLAPFRDPQTGDLGRLTFDARQSTELEPETKVVAWFDNRHPAITDQRLGKGRIVWYHAWIAIVMVTLPGMSSWGLGKSSTNSTETRTV